MDIRIAEIGTMVVGQGHCLKLRREYIQGLSGLSGFSHAVVVWYADRSPAWDPSMLVIKKPYRLAPGGLGVFATRSPVRPNPVCVSVAAISSIDEEQGLVTFFWTDLEEGTPVLDLKPYHPSADRIRDAVLPGWCAHWPSCAEESPEFPWDREFLFDW